MHVKRKEDYITRETLENPLEMVMKKRDTVLELEIRGIRKSQELLRQTETERQKITSEFEKLHQFLVQKEQDFLAQLKEIDEAILKTQDENINTLLEERTLLSNLLKEMEKNQQKPENEFLEDVRTILRRHDNTKLPMPTSKFPDLDKRIKIFTQKHLCLSHCLQQFKENLPSSVIEIRDSMTLDPETANAFLMVTEDHQNVKNIGTKQDVSRNPKRFSYFSCVLGAQGFNSGKHYWDTEVTHGGYWGLGVVKESVNRKQWFKLRPEEGIWAIGLYQSQYQALTSPCTSIVLKENPKKIRVILDYEEGLVSFYNTETMSHIFTFSATFTEKVFPFFWLPSKGSHITICPTKESCFP
ncbi:tripartite motif-containing protein 10-like [Dromiciops gliroides]|uniref:tripartite motif-containing protein 10-like n=1 Tax=Dromiciops gliroides TaxID=33562 RepID=UPI001CC6BF99|nr:tripartite motif-containing protein 10-like [Dromiciops gliroides]